MGLLKISYNVNGLHSALKRKKILRQLRQSQCQIAFLQKTHLSDVEHEKLKKSWADKVYFSSHPSGRKKGVSILIHKQVNFSLVTIHKDAKGRFILLNGSIDGIDVSFMNVYAPNEDNPDFIRKVFNVITQHSSGILLMGGDFNCVMSQFMDKQPVSTTPPSRMSKTLKYQSTELGLVDAWRGKYLSCRDFTFYSHRHASYSRIDYFFTPKAELYRISDLKILPMTISDHSPIELSWNIGHKSSTKQWRLNASLLNDKEFINLITTELKFYQDTDTSPEISPLILWDCAKAYLRGRIISFASARKKKRDTRKQELEQTIVKLEQQHKKSLSPTLLTNLRDAQREYDSLVTEKIEGNLRFINQKYYEHGNRASQLLAFRLRKQRSSNVVKKLKRNNPPKPITKPDEIAECFAGFYKSLYENTDNCSDGNALTSFLENIKLTELSETMAKDMDEPIEE